MIFSPWFGNTTVMHNHALNRRKLMRSFLVTVSICKDKAEKIVLMSPKKLNKSLTNMYL